MTLIFLQYPPVFILLLTAALLTLAAARLTRHVLILGFLSGIAAVAMLLCGLFYAVPLTELLALLLVLVLLCGYACRRGWET